MKSKRSIKTWLMYVAAAVIIGAFAVSLFRVREPGRYWPGDTVLGRVGDEEMTLADLRAYHEAMTGNMDERYAVHKHLLLEYLLRQKVLHREAKQHEIDATDEYRTILERLGKDEESLWMSGAQMQRRAMADAYIRTQVVDRLDIEEEDLRTMYELQEPFMPDDMTMDDARPVLLETLQRQYVERHIKSLMHSSDVHINGDWVRWMQEETEREAERHGAQCMCPSCM